MTSPPTRAASPSRATSLAAVPLPRTAAASLVVAASLALAGCGDGSEPTAPGGPGGGGFPTVEAMVEELETLASRFPQISDVVDLTTRYGTPPTHGGRHLHAIKISDHPGLEEDEPRALVVAAHHGNEIGTPMVALDVAARLTEGYGADPEVTALVDEYEIWIAPVWNPDGYPGSRKNGRPGGGVDLNRNYPFLWDSGCSGSTNPGSSGYKGPEPGSEPETRTMMAFAEDRRFTKVLDFHSSGREAVYGYRCSTHHLGSYLEAEAEALSAAASYGGAHRQPSAEGEHYHWQLGTYANFAFLMEIGTTQSPSRDEAVEEAERLWPGTLWLLARPIPVRGHVTDAVTGAPLSASVQYLESPFTHGERNTAEPEVGRYHAFLPTGAWTLRFSHAGYQTREVPVDVPGQGIHVDVELEPTPVSHRP